MGQLIAGQKSAKKKRKKKRKKCCSTQNLWRYVNYAKQGGGCWGWVRYSQVSQSGKCEGVLRDAGDLVLGQRECVQMLQRGGKHVRTQLRQAILVEVTREGEGEREEDVERERCSALACALSG